MELLILMFKTLSSLSKLIEIAEKSRVLIKNGTIHTFFTKQTPNLVIDLDSQGNIVLLEDEFRRAAKEILFRVREGREIKLRFEIPEMLSVKTRFNFLKGKKKLTPDELDERSKLQKIFHQSEINIKRLENNISELSKLCMNVYTSAFYSDGCWEKILKGAIEINSLSFRQSQPLRKLDIWIEGESELYAPIYVTNIEMQLIMDTLEIDHIQALSFGPGNYSANELPNDIILTRVIPSIFVAISKYKENSNLESVDLKIYYPYAWNVGLG